MRYLHLAQDKVRVTPSPLDLLEFPNANRASAVHSASHSAPATRPALEVAYILRARLGRYRDSHRLSPQQHRAAIARQE